MNLPRLVGLGGYVYIAVALIILGFYKDFTAVEWLVFILPGYIVTCLLYKHFYLDKGVFDKSSDSDDEEDE